MSENHVNPLPDQITYRPLRERYTLVNEVTLRKSIHASPWDKTDETPHFKNEVTDIIFKSVQFVSQLKQKA